MKKTLTYQSPDQATFAEQFAQPDQYKHLTELREEVLESRLLPRRSGKEREIVNCVSVERVPQSQILMGLDSVPFCNDQSNPDSTPYVQRAVFYADKIVVFPEFLPDHQRQYPNAGKIENLTRGRFNGYISRSAGITIRKRLEGWIKSVYMNRDLQKTRARPKHSHIGFLTVTLPSKQIHDDNEIKRKILQPFLQQLKRVFGIEIYFWSAEPQESGNIHFHILVDRWLDKEKVNDYWNIATDNLGYLKRYVDQTGEVRPPSTNIRACPPDMSLVKYVMKYVSKQPEIRLSCRPVGDPSIVASSTRSEWKECKTAIGEGGEIIHRSGKSIKKVVSCSYWAKEEVKGGLKQAVEMGLQVLSDEVEIIGSRVFRSYERRPIAGRSWNMSKQLKSVGVHSSYCSKRVFDLLSVLKWDPSVRISQGDYHEVYHCNVYDKLLRLDQVLLSDYRNHYIKTYKQLYQPELFEQAIEVDQPPDPPPVPNVPPSYHWKQLSMAV